MNHWSLSISESVARLVLDVKEDVPYRPGYQLKLNSYDLGVDLELADVVERLRFEHPEVRVVVMTSGKDRIFSAGANIYMLASSSHAFKVNFCKFTNETRLAMEDASAHSGQKYLAAVNGTCAGGGYELALACDEIILVDDGASAVSLPEVPLLGVLPGTGGLTRLVDKRKVRRDYADVFSTVAEGIKGAQAAKWGLVDVVVPRSKFDEEVNRRAQRLAKMSAPTSGPGVVLDPVTPTVDGDTLRYRHVTLAVDRPQRTATLLVQGPATLQPESAEAIFAQGCAFWPLQAFRELDDALLRLRFDFEEIGLVAIKTRGDRSALLALDRTLLRHREHWFVREVLLKIARTLRRLDGTARSFFAILDEESCFCGTLLELALACDRSYMLADAKGRNCIQASELNRSAYPMWHGPTRTAVRFLAHPEQLEPALARTIKQPLSPEEAVEAGFVTIAADELDFADEVRVAMEERASLSPDALTGMEANLRFPGAEPCDAKIFGRLSAWQNWIFIRPNATGDRGALRLYGKPERAQFDWRRT